MTATTFDGGERFPLARGQVLGPLHYVGSALLGSKLEAQDELISSNGFCGMTDTLGGNKVFARNQATKKPAPEHPTAGAYSDRGKRIGPVFSLVEKAQDYLSRR